jgi:crossover junction endodeoxyribonuclease RuvC
VRVVGIDPGLVRTGWAVVEPAPAGAAALPLGRVTVLGLGLIAPPAGEDLPRRLAEGADALRSVLATYQPTAAALEEVFTAPRHPRSALLMAHMRGVICLVLEEAGVPVLPLTATAVKQRLTGSGHASKSQIQRMVLRLTGLSAPPRRMRWDESDALALAIAGASQLARPSRAHAASREPVRGPRRIGPVLEAVLASSRRH